MRTTRNYSGVSAGKRDCDKGKTVAQVLYLEGSHTHVESAFQTFGNISTHVQTSMMHKTAAITRHSALARYPVQNLCVRNLDFLSKLGYVAAAAAAADMVMKARQ
jgi:hypothetical protein